MKRLDGFLPPDWSPRPIDPQKKKLQRRLDTIYNAVIFLLVIVGLVLGGTGNLGLVLIVLGVIVVGIFVRALTKVITHRE
jgi:uncharacterized membrane protein